MLVHRETSAQCWKYDLSQDRSLGGSLRQYFVRFLLCINSVSFQLTWLLSLRLNSKLVRALQSFDHFTSFSPPCKLQLYVQHLVSDVSRTILFLKYTFQSRIISFESLVMLSSLCSIGSLLLYQFYSSHLSFAPKAPQVNTLYVLLLHCSGQVSLKEVCSGIIRQICSDQLLVVLSSIIHSKCFLILSTNHSSLVST